MYSTTKAIEAIVIDIHPEGGLPLWVKETRELERTSSRSPDLEPFELQVLRDIQYSLLATYRGDAART